MTTLIPSASHQEQQLVEALAHLLVLGADAVARARDGLLQLELAPRERLERRAQLVEVARPEPVEDLELQLLPLRLELRGRDGARGLARAALDEREQDRTLDIVRTQLGAVLDQASGLGDELVVAYEPVWAIGTGKTATPELAQAVHAALRETLVERLGETGARIRLLYGGSVKPSNATELLFQPDIDGALVGGASLAPGAFADIVLASLSETP